MAKIFETQKGDAFPLNRVSLVTRIKERELGFGFSVFLEEGQLELKVTDVDKDALEKERAALLKMIQDDGRLEFASSIIGKISRDWDATDEAVPDARAEMPPAPEDFPPPGQFHRGGRRNSGHCADRPGRRTASRPGLMRNRNTLIYVFRLSGRGGPGLTSSQRKDHAYLHRRILETSACRGAAHLGAAPATA